MAFDVFLRLGDVKGGSTDANHKDEIVVKEYSFGVSNTGSVGSAGGAGAGAGKASFSDLHFTAPASIASPKLMLACASGAHYDTAVLTLRRGGGKGVGQEFFRLTMKTVLVSSYQDAGSSGDDVPMDSVTLAFGGLKVDYVPQTASGTAGPTSSAGWDRTKNQRYNG